MASTGFTAVNPAGTPAPAPNTTPAVTAAPATNTNGGTKRKRDAQLKFYAVRIGKEPGIYHTWAECLQQVRGFPKAIFKSFTSLTDAENFLHDDSGHVNGISGGKSMGNPQKWYGVRSGRVPGVYNSWNEVLDQIRGWKAPKHRGFKSRSEAEAYVREGQQPGYEGALDSIEVSGPAKKKVKTTIIKDENGSPDPTSPTQTIDYPPGEAPLDGAEDDFDPAVTLDPYTGTSLRYKTAAELAATTYQAVRPVPSAPIRIYTDGSSLSNGREDAIAGVGVYFGPGDRRNISEGLGGTKQTNQRAELTAIQRALEVAPKDRKIIILTDSNYAINCLTSWFRKWKSNNYLNAAGKPVENRDLIQKIIENLEERYRMNAHRVRVDEGEVEDERVEEDESEPPGPWERGPAGVKFSWVKGHSEDVGNEAADGLATAGAREAREILGAGDEIDD